MLWPLSRKDIKSIRMSRSVGIRELKYFWNPCIKKTAFRYLLPLCNIIFDDSQPRTYALSDKISIYLNNCPFYCIRHFNTYVL